MVKAAVALASGPSHGPAQQKRKLVTARVSGARAEKSLTKPRKKQPGHTGSWKGARLLLGSKHVRAFTRQGFCLFSDTQSNLLMTEFEGGVLACMGLGDGDRADCPLPPPVTPGGGPMMRSVPGKS